MSKAAAPGFRLGTIASATGDLPVVERGPENAPIRLLIVPPLFEEMNRCRQAMADIGRRLADNGIASLLPDLPGTGDSSAALEAVRWGTWCDSVQSLAAMWRATHVLALRGGSLLTNALDVPVFHLAPITSGDRIWRDLVRARITADREAGRDTTRAMLEDAADRGQTVELAGYALPASLVTVLRAATIDAPAPDMALRPDDPGFDGPPVWLQAEPLPAARLAEAVVNWLSAKLAG